MEQSSGVGIASSREQNAFWQFSDQLRLQTSGLSSLSLGDSIWSDAYLRRSEGRRNLDVNGGGSGYQPPADLGWKMGGGGLLGGQKLAFGGATGHPVNRYNNNNADEKSGDLKSGKYFQTNNNTSGSYNNYNDNFQINSNTSGSYNNYNGNGDVKNYFNKAINKPVNGNSNHGGKKKNTNSGTGDKNKSRNNNNNNNNSGGAMDKRFKTLPPSEALPRNEAIGGYIFVCNNDTMEENLKRQLFGLPSRYRDSVRAITPGLPLFLYNYSTHQLHGVFEATSFGGTNIDPTAWEDKKCPGESRFPAQVKVMTRRICEPLEEDAFRPILHHYDGPKFRLELNVEEAIQVLDKFAEN